MSAQREIDEFKNKYIELRVQGALPDKIIIAWNDVAAGIVAAKKKREAEGKEQHRLYTLEKAKIENSFPEAWNYRHIAQWRQQLFDNCMKYPLEDMKRYIDEMHRGQHSAEFNHRSFDEALTYISFRYNERLAAATPIETQKKER